MGVFLGTVINLPAAESGRQIRDGLAQSNHLVGGDGEKSAGGDWSSPGGQSQKKEGRE
jgi:hypothetical protein